MQLGSTIAKLRQEHGWKQSELAEKLGVHPNHIGRWEKNQMRPRAKMLDRIAAAFGVSVEDLVGVELEIPTRLSREDPELAELVGQLVLLDDEQRRALRMVVRSMLACRQLQDLAANVGNRKLGLSA